MGLFKALDYKWASRGLVSYEWIVFLIIYYKKRTRSKFCPIRVTSITPQCCCNIRTWYLKRLLSILTCPYGLVCFILIRTYASTIILPLSSSYKTLHLPRILLELVTPRPFRNINIYIFLLPDFIIHEYDVSTLLDTHTNDAGSVRMTITSKNNDDYYLYYYGNISSSAQLANIKI